MQVKKITPKLVNGGAIDIEAVLAAPSKKLTIMTVYGQAVASKTGKKIMPDGSESAWQALVGQFEAVSRDGEMFESSTLFLPEICTTPLLLALQHGATEFAFVIGAVYKKDSPTKYEFTFESLIPLPENSAIVKLRRSISHALPAPTHAPLIK